MLKIWGRTNSVNVQKVMWCVGELGLAHERVDAGLAFGRVNDPDYRALNPNGLVPTIEDDGFVLWESNAIVRYLAAKHSAGRMCPAGLQERADAERWMDWQQTSLFGPLGTVFITLVRTPPEKRDMQAVEAARLRTIDRWSVLDARLAGRRYVMGDAFTMADIPLGCCVYRWYAMSQIERPTLANLEAWYARLQEHPAFREHVMLPLS